MTLMTSQGRYRKYNHDSIFHRESVTINMVNYKKVYVVIGICYYFRKKW